MFGSFAIQNKNSMYNEKFIRFTGKFTCIKLNNQGEQIFFVSLCNSAYNYDS